LYCFELEEELQVAVGLLSQVVVVEGDSSLQVDAHDVSYGEYDHLGEVDEYSVDGFNCIGLVD
jgi:hypothetical protein